MTHDRWPPDANVSPRRLYFNEGGKLSFDAPAASAKTTFDSYVSDPANPVPYRPRPIRLREGWGTWLVEDQRFVHRRPDVLDYATEPLKEDVVVSGKIAAHLFAATTGTDSDWIVKLIDVYPDKYAADPTMGGYQLMIAGDVVRGRYHKSIERPEPLVADAVVEVPDRVSRQRSRLPRRPPHHGPGAEHVVSGHRSQSAAIRAEHLRGRGHRLPSRRPSASIAGCQASHIALPVVAAPARTQ